MDDKFQGIALVDFGLNKYSNAYFPVFAILERNAVVSRNVNPKTNVEVFNFSKTLGSAYSLADVTTRYVDTVVLCSHFDNLRSFLSEEGKIIGG